MYQKKKYQVKSMVIKSPSSSQTSSQNSSQNESDQENKSPQKPVKHNPLQTTYELEHMDDKGDITTKNLKGSLLSGKAKILIIFWSMNSVFFY